MKVIVPILFLIMISCHAQSNNRTNPNNELTLGEFKKEDRLEINIKERFRVDEFNKNNSHFNQKNFVLPNGDKVQQFKKGENIEEGFVEKTNKYKSPYSIYKQFYGGGQIKLYGENFYGFPIGTWKEYNDEETLIKETNWDLPYKFSIKDLEQKMKKEYGIDILNVNQVFTISREIEQEKSLTYYIVTVEINFHEFQEYLIDGTLGKTLFISKPSYDEDEKGIIQKYFDQKKRKENLYTRYKGKEYTEEEWKAYIKTDEYKARNK